MNVFNVIPRSIMTKRSGAVQWILLNRPEKKNALTIKSYQELNELFDQIEDDESIRVIVLTGSGDSFCVGSDLTMEDIATQDGTIDSPRLVRYARRAASTISRLREIDRPTIAAINGLALAGGLEIVASCDVVIAAESARIGECHLNYGLVPGGGGTTHFVKTVGPTVAKYLAFTGYTLPAQDFLPFGFVNEVVPDGELELRASEVAGKIAEKSPNGLKLMKRSINDAHDQSYASALHAEHMALALHAYSSEMQEGVETFRTKTQGK